MIPYVIFHCGGAGGCRTWIISLSPRWLSDHQDFCLVTVSYHDQSQPEYTTTPVANMMHSPSFLEQAKKALPGSPHNWTLSSSLISTDVRKRLTRGVTTASPHLLVIRYSQPSGGGLPKGTGSQSGVRPGRPNCRAAVPGPDGGPHRGRPVSSGQGTAGGCHEWCLMIQ